MAPTEEQDEPDLLPGVAVGLAVVLTALLSVWAAFLVPLRLGGTVLPLWLLPLGAMLAAALWAGRRAGAAGALLPAVLWLAVTWLGFASTRAEGDLVVPGTASGQAYLFGGLVLWVVVVARSYAPLPGPAAPAEEPASPGRPARR